MDPINSLSVAYVERMYAEYLKAPDKVDHPWRSFFEQAAQEVDNPGRSCGLGSPFRPASIFSPVHGQNGKVSADQLRVARLQERVDHLVRNYRIRGHLVAKVDPLGRPRPELDELNPAFYGFSDADLDIEVSTVQVQGPDVQTVRGMVERLRRAYCQSIGVQFMHVHDLAVREWVQERVEADLNHSALSPEKRKQIAVRLTQAVVFEEFLQKKFLGAKSFSLEGAETLLPLLELAIEKAAHQGVCEIALGMAHRGRLNVLANILDKPVEQIFREFEGKDPEQQEKGDVKYHLGHSRDWIAGNGRKIHLSLAFNPSHLEFISPIVLGRTRAKQDRFADFQHEQGMALLIHGDAAFAGEGVVQETLNLSQLPAYTTGGTLHIILNNQIGFTTLPEEGRSSIYATDVAKLVEAPIFHVNGEDPEAVAHVVSLAMDFRKEFRRDVVIDMYCYRRRGHNEADEPSFTQPVLYREIQKRPPVRETFLQNISGADDHVREEADEAADAYREHLAESYERARGDVTAAPPYSLQGVWKSYRGGLESSDEQVKTGLEVPFLANLLEGLTAMPDDFHLHRKLEKFMKRRREMARGERSLDWAAAETLALASLAFEGYRIRLSGQDTRRGTFSQRHAVLHDVKDGHTYTPLCHVAPDQAPVEIINSPLSETGALGFEYGFSLDYPDALVAWEAQFGDFWNAAQVIVDQFLASAEEKWRRLSGIVLLLPHGFEGQGPEHSSARIERFLSLATQDNIQVVIPSTPAQYYHVLRRQMLRRWLKPLIVITPKSLLRHPKVVSSLEDLANTSFQRVIADVAIAAKGDIRRILLCSGKIYYELVERREELQRNDVAILRLEQLYPFPHEQLHQELSSYSEGTPVVWVQEEPRNMGACGFLEHRFREGTFKRIPFDTITRAPSASPATGSAAVHRREQEELMCLAFETENRNSEFGKKEDQQLQPQETS